MSLAQGEHVADFLPAFVMEDLPEDEMRQVKDHLAKCPSCRADLAFLQQMAAELPLALAQAAPPPELKSKLMQSIRSHKPGQEASTARPRSLPNLAEYLRGHFVAFGLALIVILALGNVWLWRQLNLAVQTTHTPQRLVTLSNTQFAPGANGTLVVSPNGHDFTLVVADLARLDVSKQYQVWLIKGTGHTSVGVFSVDPNGYASLEISAPESLTQYDAIGISIEPAGGSQMPTGSSVLRGDLPK